MGYMFSAFVSCNNHYKYSDYPHVSLPDIVNLYFTYLGSYFEDNTFLVFPFFSSLCHCLRGNAS